MFRPGFHSDPKEVDRIRVKLKILDVAVSIRFNVNHQELRINTQKSRIEELENMLNLSSEQQNLLRKQNLVHLDKQEMLRRDQEKGQQEYNLLLKKLAEAEAKLSESDRRVEVKKKYQILSLWLVSFHQSYTFLDMKFQ